VLRRPFDRLPTPGLPTGFKLARDDTGQLVCHVETTLLNGSKLKLNPNASTEYGRACWDLLQNSTIS
jgi:hypothetical protein